MKKIPLTQGKYALVDDADFEWLSQWKWFYIKDGYAVRSDYSNVYRSPGGHRSPKQIKMHRQVMDEPEGLEVDHKNTDRLDNRRSNLRVATHGQNKQNSRLQKNNTSGYKGVSWCTQIGKWRVSLNINGKIQFFGSFSNPREGAKVYNKIASKRYGEYARLNDV